MSDVHQHSMAMNLPALPQGWRWVRFSDLCHRVSVGHVGPTTQHFVPNGTGVRLVRSQNVRPGKLVLDDVIEISNDFNAKLKKSQLQPGDVLIVRVGANRSDCCVVPENVGPINCANIVFARPHNSGKFYSYYFNTNFGRRMLLGTTTGAAQEVINTGSVADSPVPLPPRYARDRIAGILSAYDELIENNRRRIGLLEQAARLLYREWFVHLRFPGHETAKIVDGLPEGWTMKPLSELADMVMGQSPKSEFYNEAGEGLPFHQGVTNYGFRFAEDTTFSSSVTKLAEAGDILFSVRAPVGRINLTMNKIILGRGLAAFRSKSGHQSSLFYNLKNHFFKEDLIGGGAIFAATNKKELEKLMFLSPSPELLDEFEASASAIDAQIKVITLKNRQLTRARDLLLPRLMDGRIPV